MLPFLARTAIGAATGCIDRNVEAYLARFNAARRERGEVPDIPEATWAWERQLAFFVGEPALEYKLADDWPFQSMVHETD
jgi:hypothetical protein